MEGRKINIDSADSLLMAINEVEIHITLKVMMIRSIIKLKK